MADDNLGEADDIGLSFSIGPPAAPIPQAELETRWNRTTEKGGGGFSEVDYQSHRNVYVAVHVPYSLPKRHKHHRRKHHHKKLSALGSLASEPPGAIIPDEPTTPLDPCDRVKFILETGSSGDVEGDGACHSIFTELEELRSDHHNRVEWKETARWVKFEEDVEEGGNKWSKPHVATLSLHSLFDLRRCISKGTVLLNMEATDIGQIADYVLDSLVSTNQLEEANREKVRKALLLRHKHQNTKDHENRFVQNILSMADIGRISSSSKHMDQQSQHAEGDNVSPHSSQTHLTPYNHPHPYPVSASNLTTFAPSIGRKMSSASNNSNDENGREERENGDSGQDVRTHKPDLHFMKKIPPGSEASNVLVGEVEFLNQPIIAFVRLSKGVLLRGITEVPIPTRFLFIMLGPKGNRERYHEVGRSIATLMSDEVFHDVAYKARNREDLLAGVDEFLDKVTVLPPGEWDPKIRLEPPPQVPSQDQRRHAKSSMDDELHAAEDEPQVTCSKIPFSGVIADVKRRYPKYWSDIKDSFSIQVVASIIFIFFANITPAVTFGGVLADITENNLGALEMILAVGVGNIVYSLTAGQPLVILGGTGPTLIFEDIVYTFSKQNNIPYLNFRFWIGLWTGIMLILMVAFNASGIMRLFTRFTEEIFSALISFIFIYEAMAKVWNVHIDFSYNEWILFPTIRRQCDCYEFGSNVSLADGNFSDATKLSYFWDDPDNCTQGLTKLVGKHCSGLHPNVFLMSIILFFGTFMVSYYLKKFRNSSFFSALFRRIISDFAVFIAVIVWVVVDLLVDIDTPKLIVPDVFSEGFYSNPNRGFIINPVGNSIPGWAPVMAIAFAFLASVLLFMDQQITALIVNRKDHKLKKGSGYHLDLLIVAVMIIVHSLLGLPWVVGATVRSITHVQSLFIFSPCTAPGERPKFLGVREQRVTLFSMAFLLAVSVMLYHALRLLPLPVLYGIFLYIGVASLYGVQFVQRLALPFIPDKYKPDYPYLRLIPNIRIHAYTLFQVVFFLLLCIFKIVQQISIVFPIMVLLLVGARWMAGLIFRWDDLEILDDSIPDKMYCQYFRTKNRKQEEGLVETKSRKQEEGLVETKNRKQEEGLVDEEVKVEGDIDSKPGDSNGSPPQRQKSGEDLNISQAVDNSGIWRNMVRSLDAPLPSPHHKSRYKPAPLTPVITEERESELQSPRQALNHTPLITVSASNEVSPSNAVPDLNARRSYQVTTV